jgi:alkylation response protein AidB-like acyl-CoA dehydrogenase
MQVTDECLQLFGGYGYMIEYPIARLYADSRVQRIYGGTTEIMKDLIARKLFGRPSSAEFLARGVDGFSAIRGELYWK